MRRVPRSIVEQLMRQIMHYDVEFRREEATSAVSSFTRSTDGQLRVDDLNIVQFDPTPTLGQAGRPFGGAREISARTIRSTTRGKFSSSHDFSMGLKRFANHIL